MPAPGRDPYQTLGVRANATDAELRAAYRRLVQLHHPDHNGGSAESANRFEEVQEAYSRIKELRAAGAQVGSAPPPPRDPDLESRLADMERDLHAAQRARERAERAREEALQAARRAATEEGERPSDEELGYVKTDDSLSKIITDARSELADRLSKAREHPMAKRASDLIDELDEFVSKTIRDPRR